MLCFYSKIVVINYKLSGPELNCHRYFVSQESVELNRHHFSNNHTTHTAHFLFESSTTFLKIDKELSLSIKK